MTMAKRLQAREARQVTIVLYVVEAQEAIPATINGHVVTTINEVVANA